MTCLYHNSGLGCQLACTYHHYQGYSNLQPGEGLLDHSGRPQFNTWGGHHITNCTTWAYSINNYLSSPSSSPNWQTTSMLKSYLVLLEITMKPSTLELFRVFVLLSEFKLLLVWFIVYLKPLFWLSPCF